MISIEQALKHVLANALRQDSATLPVAESVGCILGEDITSDVDSPPHDKSLVDGYAIADADLVGGSPLELLEEVTAGRCPTRPVSAGKTTRIMTGAPVPEGTAAVVMVEESRLQRDGSQTYVHLAPARSGQNVMLRGTSLQRGNKVLTSGDAIRPIEVGILAEVGREQARIIPRPRVAILATGDELVPASSLPGPGTIRNSNGPLLKAATEQAGGIATDLGIGRDDLASLSQLVDRGLDHEVLVLSGGVSAGVLDLVPQVLQESGVREVFHKVRLKPGKPLWFGVHEQRKCLVFGLPGNPVSSFVCFELFVRAALDKLAGRPVGQLTHQTAQLLGAYQTRGNRPAYHPAHLDLDPQGQWQARPLKYHGSADLRTLAGANGLAFFEPREAAYAVGEPIPVFAIGQPPLGFRLPGNSSLGPAKAP